MDFNNRKYLNAESQKSLRTTTFQRKDIIFVKGESGQTMYEVLNGSVGVYLNYGKPDEVLLAVKRVGEYLGEIALIEDRPRTATAVAMEYDTMLREISINGFANYVKEKPEVLKPITDAMANRFKQQRKDYIDACKTLAEYRDAVESGEKISKELKQKVDKYAEDSNKEWLL